MFKISNLIQVFIRVIKIFVLFYQIKKSKILVYIKYLIGIRFKKKNFKNFEIFSFKILYII